MQVRYYTKDASWLCFKHAVEQANKGIDVETEIDNFNSDYYMGTTTCVVCKEIWEAEEIAKRELQKKRNLKQRWSSRLEL